MVCFLVVLVLSVAQAVRLDTLWGFTRNIINIDSFFKHQKGPNQLRLEQEEKDLEYERGQNLILMDKLKAEAAEKAVEDIMISFDDPSNRELTPSELAARKFSNNTHLKMDILSSLPSSPDKIESKTKNISCQ